MQWDYYNIDDNDAEVNQYVSKNVFVCDVKTKTERKKNKIWCEHTRDHSIRFSLSFKFKWWKCVMKIKNQSKKNLNE